MALAVYGLRRGSFYLGHRQHKVRQEGCHMKARKLVRFSDDLPRRHWIARQLLPGTSLRSYAEEGAISHLVSFAAAAIDACGMTRKEVAELLGTTKGNVSQLLNGSRNMTVKSFGALLWACGWEVDAITVIPVGGRTQIRRRRSPTGGRA
jgi:predicted XRE-type DNA-binding protein